MEILIAIHHTLSSDTGAPGADLSLCHAMAKLGNNGKILSHDDLPKWARWRISIFVFPLLVAKEAFVGRHRWDVLDFTSQDGWLATFLPRGLRPRVLAFHSHGLEHVVHERFEEDCRRGAQRMSWKYPLYRGSLHLWQVAHAARGADLCILLNEQERDWAVNRLGVRSDKAELTINAIDPALLEVIEKTTAVPVQDEKALNVAFIGTYVERKGIAYLMPALAAYLIRHVDAKALLLGTGADAERVCADMPAEVRSRIEVIPQFKKLDLPSLLSDSHVFLLPSLSEGFAISGLEAMACGLVPVVTRGHGFEAYVTDGENGFLIDRADVGQIESSLEKLHANRPLYLRFREAAREKAKTFTWERAARMRLDMYERARGRIAGRQEAGQIAQVEASR